MKYLNEHLYGTILIKELMSLSLKDIMTLKKRLTEIILLAIFQVKTGLEIKEDFPNED